MSHASSTPSPESDGHFVMIPLTRGKFAIVDEDDADLILQMGKWCAVKGWNTYYATRGDPATGRPVSMHRVIVGYKRADHVNRNGLDNRRSNLRPATKKQNAANTGPRSDNTSGFKGVTWYKDRGKWAAQIKTDKRLVCLGFFADPVDAARAYNAAALETWGEFAWLNPIPGEAQPPAA